MIDPAFAPTQEGKYGPDPLQFVAYACKEKLFTAKVKVKGLQPNTKYYYRFKYYEFNTTVSGGAADRPPIDHQWGYPAMTQVGQFKTLPSPGEHVESFKIGVLGCSAPFNGIFNSYYQLAKLEPDLVIHTSDYTYADSNAYEAGNILTPTELLKYPNTQLGVPHYMPESVAEYSLYYDRMHVEPDVQELHRKAAWVLNIGDHELSNDWDVTQYGTNWANYLNHGGKKSYEEVMEAGTLAWLLNLPVDDIDGRLSPAFDSRLEGFVADPVVANWDVADPAWDDVDKKSPKFHADKDWAGHIGDLAYFHVLDDYSDVDLIDYQDIVKNDDGSFGVYYKNCDDTQGIREGDYYHRFVKRPCMDKIDPKEDPQRYKDILKVYDKYYLKTSRISRNQMKRIESGFAAAAETTWKLTSVGVPQTVFHALIAGGELPPDYGKPYDVFVWPQNSYTANLYWPYGSSSSEGSPAEMAADIAGYAALQREMYSDGEVTYPFVATYQNEGDLSRRKLQDIFKKYPNNINVFGDYHTQVQSQAFHYDDLIEITKNGAHAYDKESGMYVDSAGKPIYPLLTAVKPGTQAYYQQSEEPGTPEDGAIVQMANDFLQKMVPGTIQFDSAVNSARAVMMITLTHAEAKIDWIDGGGHGTPEDWVGRTKKQIVNWDELAKYDEVEEKLTHPFVNRVDKLSVEATYIIEATSTPGQTKPVRIEKAFPASYTRLDCDAPYSLCDFTSEEPPLPSHAIHTCSRITPAVANRNRRGLRARK